MTKQTRLTSPETNPTTISIPELRAVLNDRVTAPDDAGYDEARAVFYGGIDRRTAVIIRVASATDVSQVVSLARETGLNLAVRSGGHSLAGHSTTDGGIVLDLSDRKALQIDTERRTAWTETGLTAGEYPAVVGAHGLATGFGDTGSVGIGGITLSGGVGYLVRKYGLTIDDLLAADVVTADGRLLRVDAETHPDLFWAIRGGGGNFGVATRFRFRLHEVDTIVGGMLLLPATPDVIDSFVAEAEAAPEELSAIANIMPAPPMPFVPTEHHGRLVIMAMLVYAGEVGAGERAIAPFRALATLLADTVGPKPYPEMYEPTGPGPDEEVARSLFIDSVDSRAAETIVEHLQASTAPLAVAQLRVLGGAMARVPAEATAFAHRKRRIIVVLGAVYEHREEEAVYEDWVTGFAAALGQGDAGVYVNFLGDEGEGGSTRPTRGRPGTGSLRSRVATTRRTSSGSIRTSRQRPRVERPSRRSQAVAEKEPVAGLEPRFSSDDATPTPWAEAHEAVTAGHTDLHPSLHLSRHGMTQSKGDDGAVGRGRPPLSSSRLEQTLRLTARGSDHKAATWLRFPVNVAPAMRCGHCE